MDYKEAKAKEHDNSMVARGNSGGLTGGLGTSQMKRINDALAQE